MFRPFLEGHPQEEYKNFYRKLYKKFYTNTELRFLRKTHKRGSKHGEMLVY